MKKLCIFIVVIFVLMISVKPGRAILGYAVAGGIIAGSAIVVGTMFLLPALIKGLENKSGWASLAVPITDVATISAAVAFQAVGFPSIANSIKNYVSGSHGPTIIQGGAVGYMRDVVAPPAGAPAGTLIFGTGSMAYNALSALGHGVSAFYGVTGLGNGGGCYTCSSGCYGTTVYCYYGSGAPAAVPTFTNHSTGSAGSLASDLATDISAGNVGAINLAKAALTELDGNIQGTSSSLGTTLTNSGKTILNNAVTQAQADAIAGTTPKTPEEIAAEAGTAALTTAQMQAAVRAALAAQGLSSAELLTSFSAALALNPGLTAAQAQAAVTAAMAANPNLTGPQTQAAVEAALVAQGLTATGVATAVKAAIDNQTGVVEPTETTTIVPTKLSLTTVMGSFMASINALPGLTTLRGLHVTCGGSSVLCLSVLGAQGCYDAAQIQGLDTVGSTLFGLVSLVSFVGIFRG